MLHNFITGYDNIQADIKYSIPFYSLTKTISSLNPQKKGGVELLVLECSQNEEKSTNAGDEKAQMDGRYNVRKNIRSRL
jgi:hypothetical protein